MNAVRKQRASDSPGVRSPALVGWIAIGIFAALGPVMARAQTFDTPEGFAMTIERTTRLGDAHTILRVQPSDGAFARLSSIEMQPLPDAIEDPDSWLTDRMRIDFGDPIDEDGLDELFDSPDTPFYGDDFETLREVLRDLTRKFEDLGEWPLSFCDDPDDARTQAGTARQLSCVYALGPLQQFVVLRLQVVDDIWYYTVIKSMNERRLRHLTAIANSFQVE